MGTADTPTGRLRENAVGIASMLVLGLGLLALFAGFDLFWVVFVIGFAVVVPIVATLYGDEDERSEWWNEEWQDGWGSNSNRERNRSERHEQASTDQEIGRDEGETTDTPLETIRRRYARGELTDAQFERKLELLLETETLEDAEDRYRARELVREREE